MEMYKNHRVQDCRCTGANWRARDVTAAGRCRAPALGACHNVDGLACKVAGLGDGAACGARWRFDGVGVAFAAPQVSSRRGHVLASLAGRQRLGAGARTGQRRLRGSCNVAGGWEQCDRAMRGQLQEV
jgi:hypothetical protein